MTPPDPDGVGFTAGAWTSEDSEIYAGDVLIAETVPLAGDPQDGHPGFGAQELANAALIAASPDQNAALNYVADMTYCGADGEWRFKPGYNPQVVLAALSKARGQ